MVRGCAFALLSLVLWLAAAAPAESDVGSRPPIAAGEVGDEPTDAWVAAFQRQLESAQQFRRMGLVRGGIAAAGFAVFAWGVWLRRRGGAGRLQGLRVVLLVSLATASFGGYYGFFAGSHVGGFKGPDVFHYYMGSKYFAELGYFELYHCTLAALVEDGALEHAKVPAARSQRTLRLESVKETRAGMRACPDRFAPARWSEFKRDVAFFKARVLGQSWRHLPRDHGYNPTPVWTFVGGWLAKSVDSDSEGFRRLILLDRALVVAMGGLLAWAFGIEVACLAALAWGASPLWSYNWIGDAFLRYLWLFGAVAGLCLLERGRHLAAGLFLALAALLRVFPGIAAAGVVAHVLYHWRGRGVPPPARRLALGLALGAALLLAAGAFGTGRGPGAFVEFTEKMSVLVEKQGVNKVGLSALADHLVDRATTRAVVAPSGRTVELREPAPVTVATVRAVQGLLVLIGLAAFVRALGRCTDAEAAMLAFALVPLLTSPGSYYYGFSVVAAMLSYRRPFAGLVLCGAVLAWIAAAQIWFLDDLRYRVWDAIAVAFSLALLVGVAVSRPPAPAPDAGGLPTTA